MHMRSLGHTLPGYCLVTLPPHWHGRQVQQAAYMASLCTALPVARGWVWSVPLSGLCPLDNIAGGQPSLRSQDRQVNRPGDGTSLRPRLG